MHPNSMDFLRSTSWTPTSGLQCPAEDQSLMEWLRYLPKYSNYWLVVPHTTSIALRICVEQANKETLLPWKCLSSYDVTALFTSVLVEPALGIIKELLEKDNTPKERTGLPVKDIILLLEFYLHNTYFSFQSQFFEQVEGVAMGFPVCPIVANLYMDYFE